jgi:hypothetical protein
MNAQLLLLLLLTHVTRCLCSGACVVGRGADGVDAMA